MKPQPCPNTPNPTLPLTGLDPTLPAEEAEEGLGTERLELLLELLVEPRLVRLRWEEDMGRMGMEGVTMMVMDMGMEMVGTVGREDITLMMEGTLMRGMSLIRTYVLLLLPFLRTNSKPQADFLYLLSFFAFSFPFVLNLATLRPLLPLLK